MRKKIQKLRRLFPERRRPYGVDTGSRRSAGSSRCAGPEAGNERQRRPCVVWRRTTSTASSVDSQRLEPRGTAAGQTRRWRASPTSDQLLSFCCCFVHLQKIRVPRCIIFYRVMLCIARTMLWQDVRLSVRLSACNTNNLQRLWVT